MSDRATLERCTTSELLCLPFLDTDVTAELPIADTVLRARGYPPAAIRVLRAVCKVGLWHQLLFLWEWASLDVWDVVLGYAVLAVPIGLAVAIVLSVPVGLAIAAAGVAAFLGAYAGMAFGSWRRGSR